MSTKEVVYAVRDDKQEIQKQLGCMNGIFRRYFLGQRRHDHTQKRLPPGQTYNGEKKTSNELEQPAKLVMRDNQRVSTESSRNSFSSSSSSTILSSLDCSNRVQTEQSFCCQSVASEPSLSPSLQTKKPDLFIHSPDIRDVVKDSMIREPRVVSIKTVAKEERKGSPMKHIDSPRPFPDQKPVRCNRNDRNLANLREIAWGAKEVNPTSRFSCDGRESRYLSKSSVKVKELPRLSLDSMQRYISNSANDPRYSLLAREIEKGADMEPRTNQPCEPRSNRRPSSSVVARLMGLEVLTSSIDESVNLKTKPSLSKESRSSRKVEELQQDRTSVSPRVRNGLITPQRGGTHAITRIPLETAPWKQEASGRGSQKPQLKSKEAPARAEATSTSVYGEIEKRLTEHEYKTAGKDLRAVKQILEAMKKTRSRLQNIEHASETRRHEFLYTGTKPANRTPDSRKDLIGRQHPKYPTPRDRRATSEPLLNSNIPEFLPRGKSSGSKYSGNVSPRMQRSKNGVDKPSVPGHSTDMSRTENNPSLQHTHFGSTNRIPKAKSMNTLQDRVQSREYNGETRNSSQHSDTVSFRSESNSLASQNDSEVTSTEWIPEVNSVFRPKENHKIYTAERLTQDKLMSNHAKHTMEQPSPVSVLDAFYTEDTPSPVKKKSNVFSDDENLHFEDAQDQAWMNNTANNTNQYQCSELNDGKLENIKDLVHQIELLNNNAEYATVDHADTSPCESETQDHRYIMEIVLASGFLKDLDSTTTIVRLHPTGSLINPQLFDVLEKTKRCTELTEDEHHRKNMVFKSDEKIRRKMVFDTVNDVLGHKLTMLSPFGPWTKGRILNVDKLLKELCSGIDSLQNNSEKGGIYDEDDEVINIINADVKKRSQDWGACFDEVPGLVLDIERLIFKDLISEVVSAPLTGLQDWPARHRRQLFVM